MMSAKNFIKYLTSKSNKDLLEVLKNKRYYSKSMINAVRKEAIKRKKLGKLRKNAIIR